MCTSDLIIHVQVKNNSTKPLSLDKKMRRIAYNSFKFNSILLTSRETINKKFIIFTWFQLPLDKFDSYFRRNNISFSDSVKNHGAEIKSLNYHQSTS